MMEQAASGSQMQAATATMRAGLFGGTIAQFPFREKRLDAADDVKEFLALAEERGSNDDGELEGISFSSNSIGVDAAEAIGSTLQRLANMRSACMANVFGSRNLDEIPPALDSLVKGYLLSGCSLVHVDFSDNAFGAAALSRLAPLFESETLFNVQEIIFNNNGLGPSGGTLLAECLRRLYANCIKTRGEGKPPPLRRFVCGRGRLENVGIRALSEVLPLYGATLEHVQVPQNGIFEDGMATFLNSLGEVKNLRFLDVEDNCVKDAGTRALVENMPKWKKLEHLNLSSTLLGSENAVRVSESLATNCNKTIKNLYFNACEIEDVAAIDKLTECVSKFYDIEEISLIDNWDIKFSKLFTMFADSFESRDCGDYLDVLVLKDDYENEFDNVSEEEESEFEDMGDDANDEARSGELDHNGDDADTATDEDEEKEVRPAPFRPLPPAIPGPLPGMKFGETSSQPFSFDFATAPPKLPAFSFTTPSTSASTMFPVGKTSSLFTSGNIFGAAAPPAFSVAQPTQSQSNTTVKQKITKYQQVADADLEAVLPTFRPLLQKLYADGKVLGQQLQAANIRPGEDDKIFSTSAQHREALSSVLSSMKSLLYSARIADADAACRRSVAKSSPGQFLPTNSTNTLRQRMAFELLCIKLVDVFGKQSPAAAYVLFVMPLHKILTTKHDADEAMKIDDPASVLRNCCVTLRIILELTDFVDRLTLKQWAEKVCAVKQDAWKPSLTAKESEQALGAELSLLVAEAAKLTMCTR